MFSRFESNYFGGQANEGSDEDIEITSHSKKADELDRYFNIEIDRSKQHAYPLAF